MGASLLALAKSIYYHWFKFYYPFWGGKGLGELWAVMYDNEYKTKGSKI